MAKSRKDAKRKKKALHYTLMVTHAKKALEKKRIEAFQQMIKDSMPKAQQENVVDSPEVNVDIDVDDVMSDNVVEQVTSETVQNVETEKTEN